MTKPNLLSAIFLTCCLAACGGGGDDAPAPPPPPPPGPYAVQVLAGVLQPGPEHDRARAGAVDGPARQVLLGAPPYGLSSVAAAPDGSVYMVERESMALGGGRYRLRKLSTDGAVSTVAVGSLLSDAPSPDAVTFATPVGLAVAANGDVYLADYAADSFGARASSVWRVKPGGAVERVAGSRRPWSAGRDGQGTEAAFAHLTGLCGAQDGNFYVRDVEGIRRVTPAGMVTTVPAPDGLVIAGPGARDGFKLACGAGNQAYARYTYLRREPVVERWVHLATGQAYGPAQPSPPITPLPHDTLDNEWLTPLAGGRVAWFDGRLPNIVIGDLNQPAAGGKPLLVYATAGKPVDLAAVPPVVPLTLDFMAITPKVLLARTEFALIRIELNE